MHRGRILCLLHCCHAPDLLFSTVFVRVMLIIDFGFLGGAGGCLWPRRPPRFGLGGLWWAVGRGGWWRYILYGCAGLLAGLGFGEGLKIMFKILWAMLVRLFYLLFPEMK